jgi:hypothetical protein
VAFVLLLILGILYSLFSLCGTGFTALALWLGFVEGNFTPQLAAIIAIPAAAIFLLLSATGVIYLRATSHLRRHPPKATRAAYITALANTALFSLLLLAHVTVAVTRHPNLTDFIVGSLLCAAVIALNAFLAFHLRRLTPT